MISTQKIFQTFCLILLVFFYFSSNANSSCSCSIGPNGISTIGFIYQANTCPNETDSYNYDEFYINCLGGRINAWLVGQQGFYLGSPEQIIQNLSGPNDIILRNPEGTNIIIVFDPPSTVRFNGTIQGVNISTLTPGTHSSDPPERLNQYCFLNYSNTGDMDGDNYPDCLDCAPNDPSTSLNCTDNCPDDPDKTEPDICGCGTPDTDGDGDSVPDCNDNCPADSNKTEPGDCGCGTPEADSDSDGTPDCIDECPNDPDHTDNDGDGTLNCNDNCPNDINKIEPGTCGCHAPETDTDGDTIPDCIDECPNDANNTDSDGDGTPDCIDNCPGDPEKSEPGVCGCNAPDIDSDDNGIYDCKDLDQDLNKGPQC